MKILRKTLKNYIRSKNRHFKVFFKNNIYNFSYLIIISSMWIKKYKFYKCIFIIKLHYLLFYNNIMIIYLILKYMYYQNYDPF